MSRNIKQLFSLIVKKLQYSCLSQYCHITHNRLKRRIRKTGKANICFIVSSLPMWRLQDLYRLLSDDPRYNVSLLLVPFLTYTQDQSEKSIQELRVFFDKNNCRYQLYDADTLPSKWKKDKPDIIFYQQMYRTIYPDPIRIDSNLSRLICYLPYGLITLKGEWIYNTKYTNTAWKLFYPTKMHADFARNNSFNSAKNVVVVGDPNADKFFRSSYSFPWKKQANNNMKRVIWAPHFSILNSGPLHRASFLWMADIMLEIAKKYEGSIQFTLKPHPRLVSALYSHPDWGKEKTDLYFEQWANRPNCQIETGEYIDLFMTSDAMIHDCGSFTAEYLYTCKPVLFASNSIQSVYYTLDNFGTKCMDLHYKGESQNDIISFLDTVVLGGDDPLLKSRQAFLKEDIYNETSKDVGKNIYNYLTKELFGTDN